MNYRHVIDWLDRKQNVLAFGNPGGGKMHLLCAIGQELVRAGRTVYFRSTNLLVQKLLLAKRELKLPQVIRKLARYQALILDDLGYVQQSREEVEVLFTLLAERYERGPGAPGITSNLPFSKWESIFKDAIDHGGGHRPSGASQRHSGVEPAELSGGAGEKIEGCGGASRGPGGSSGIEGKRGRMFRPPACVAPVSLRSTGATHAEEKSTMVVLVYNCRWTYTNHVPEEL